MKKTTIFTWGYHGWGNDTTQLGMPVGALERER
jgi:hypothetical protein